MRNFSIASDEINNALAARAPSILNQPSVPAAARAAGQAMWPATKAGIAGGPLVAEASMFPDQFDTYNLPPGPAQREARSNALNPMAYGERAALGALTAASGYKLPDVIVPRRQPNWARAEAAANNPPRLGGPPNQPPGGGAQSPAGGSPAGGQQPQSGGRGPTPGPLSPQELAYRRQTRNPDPASDGHWVPPPSAGGPPHVPGQSVYVSPEGRNEVFMNANGQWQRRMPDGSTPFVKGNKPPRSYRRISSSDDAPSSGGMAEFLMG
jgi:hypothetical protein